jgi:hypothetical protein
VECVVAGCAGSVSGRNAGFQDAEFVLEAEAPV